MAENVAYRPAAFPTLEEADATYFTGEFRKIAQAISGITDVWTAYTPTLTPVGGTLGTVTATGAYKKVGRTVFVAIKVSVTTPGTMTNWQVDLPFASVRDTTIMGAEPTITGKTIALNLFAGSPTGIPYIYDGTKPITAGMSVRIGGVYESVS